MSNSPIITIEIAQAYAKIHEILNKSVELLKKGNKTELDKLFNDNKTIFSNTQKLIDNLAESDKIFALIQEQNWNIKEWKMAKIVETLEKAEKINEAPNSFSDLKSKLLVLAKNFEESKKAIVEINEKIKNALLDNLPDEDKKQIKSFLDELEKIIKNVNNLKFDTKELEKLIIFNPEYFEKRMNDAKELLNIDQKTPGFLGALINILTFLSVKNKNDNLEIKGLFTDSDNQKIYIQYINGYIRLIKKDFVLMKKMESNDKEYLKQNHAIIVKDDYETKVIEMIKLLGNLDIITDKPESI
ncbi:MAG: hypothetical protein PHN56_03610 [Candidatus Nanoarchaeia archaeon]|nr:hypothetical protein [Candidatus Nanoarchaeia archaeon]